MDRWPLILAVQFGSSFRTLRLPEATIGVSTTQEPAPKSGDRSRDFLLLCGALASVARAEEETETPLDKWLFHLLVPTRVREGRKRLVKRMFSANGHEVLRLRRTRIGDLHLGDLQPGEWRELGEQDLEALAGGQVSEAKPGHS